MVEIWRGGGRGLIALRAVAVRLCCRLACISALSPDLRRLEPHSASSASHRLSSLHGLALHPQTLQPRRTPSPSPPHAPTVTALAGK
ncbi:hypothetical protein GUJ93_ZPchr0011g28402 [Zizania palustris]|uniref:Secreted protein n=1 Tax=Zizania palustris TaxID=103762 RepID=A0A8J6BLR9_ZIZPA|nr:hypothetical protein GUJ93_ZPchr0011g28402 [Zizania palustris]